jgi:class 3 adenylate cyclase
MNRVGDRDVNVEEARYMAARIPSAKLVELPGADHSAWVGGAQLLLDEIEEFLTGVRRGPDPDRVLATVLVTDIVGSTEHLTRIGDRAWSDLVERHHATIRRELLRYKGREIDTAGDGFLAVFDGPARAVRCAVEATDAVRGLGLEIRAGVHTGEVELAGAKVRGLAVHLASRIASIADPGDVLASSTVKDLVAGSGIRFEERGEHDLRGAPGRWRLFSVAAGPVGSRNPIRY